MFATSFEASYGADFNLFRPKLRSLFDSIKMCWSGLRHKALVIKLASTVFYARFAMPRSNTTLKGFPSTSDC